MKQLRNVRWTIAAALVAHVAATAVVEAQEATTGTISGQVVDAQDLPVPGATVMVTGSQGSTNVVTDGEGNFLVPFLVPGRYSVRVDLAGFRSTSIESVQVQLGQRTVLPDLTLRVSGVTAQVEVVAEAATVDPSTAAIGASLDSDSSRPCPSSGMSAMSSTSRLA